MANFTYGFYNAINGDRAYDAIQMSEIFDGVIADGVYATVGDSFMVKENLDEDNIITIGSGRAWFNHTWNKLDTKMIFSCPAPEPNTYRIDAIVIEVDEPNRMNAIKWVLGTPSNSPVKPSLKNTDGVYQHPIAYVRRLPGNTKIEQQYIENMVGTTSTPFVTGVIKSIDVSNLYAQWAAAWDAWFKKTDSSWESIKMQYAGEWEQIKTAYHNDWEGIKEEYENQWRIIKENLQKEQDDIMKKIDSWFEHDIKDKLGEDPAVKLQMQINDIYGFAHGTMDVETTFPDDNHIVEEYGNNTKVVTEIVNDNKMTQTYYKGDIVEGIKTIDFNLDGSISERYRNS